MVGLGNVALDCARVLLKGAAEMSQTDIASRALQQLQHSRVREVVLLGRRGVVQAAFTPKELREALRLPGVQVDIRPRDLAVSQADRAEMAERRISRRVHEVLSQAAEGPASAARESGDDQWLRHLRMRFLRSPVEVLGSKEAGVQGLRLEINRMEKGSKGQARAVGTGEVETLPCQLVLRSIGYRSVPIPGLPFDPVKGVANNWGGRVVTGDGQLVRGLYASGWLRRGPTGIIGTNLVDAEEVVDNILADLREGRLSRGPGEDRGWAGLERLLRGRGSRIVSWEVSTPGLWEGTPRRVPG